MCPTRRRKRRVAVIEAEYDPNTLYNCLFMCLAKELLRLHGVAEDPAFLRRCAHDLWLADQKVVGYGVKDWAGLVGLSEETFIDSTLGRRHGTAPDAILIAKLYGVGLLILDIRGRALVRVDNGPS
eukprot:3875432-Amphidinium_carterae.1